LSKCTNLQASRCKGTNLNTKPTVFFQSNAKSYKQTGATRNQPIYKANSNIQANIANCKQAGAAKNQPIHKATWADVIAMCAVVYRVPKHAKSFQKLLEGGMLERMAVVSSG
jgi:hypothetical protein